MGEIPRFDRFSQMSILSLNNHIRIIARMRNVTWTAQFLTCHRFHVTI